LISGRLAESAAELEGNSMVMSEICPVTDHAVYQGKEAPTIHVKGTINRQLVAGVNKFNNYLQLQNEDNAGKYKFNTYVARICMMMSGGKRASRISVYYPIESLWAKYRPLPAWTSSWDEIQGGDDAAQRLNRLFIDVSNALYDNHWEFSYVDAKGIVDNDLSNRDVLALPGVATIPVEAMEKIAEFCKKGGKVIALESFPSNSLTDFPSSSVKKIVSGISKKNIHYEPRFNRDNFELLLHNLVDRDLTIYPKDAVLCSHKIIDGKNIYLITNDNSRHKDLTIESKTIPLMIWNPQTGHVSPINQNRIHLDPYKSLIITERF